MAIKTYKTRELKGYSLHLFVNGVRTYVVFKGGCTLGSTATYVTANKSIQDALESLKSFGPIFYLASTEKTEEDEVPAIEVKIAEPVQEEEKEVVDILDAQTFKNIVELRRALQDKGIDVSQITNVKAAETLAKKNGYNYTVEKNA
jgi:hypothetical protein